MSPRIGPLVAAIISLTARMAGEPALADVMAVGAVGGLTLVLHRSTSLRAATRNVHTLAETFPAVAETASPAAN